MRDVYVIGAYTTAFKKHPGMSFGDLAREAYMGALADAGIRSVTRIGDCLAPGTIAAAIHDGHRFAREFGAPPPAAVPFKRERIALNAL